MPCCKAWGCSSKGTEEGVRKHRFPKDPHLLKLWLAKINRKDLTEDNVKPTAFLCSKHFTDDDYRTNPSVWKDINIDHKPRLKHGTVPSIFPDEDPSSAGRSTWAEKRSRTEVNSYILGATIRYPRRGGGH